MDPYVARHVDEGRLRLDRAPTAVLAAAAIEAQQAAGLDAADFIVIAVPPGEGAGLVTAAEQATRAAAVRVRGEAT